MEAFQCCKTMNLERKSVSMIRDVGIPNKGGIFVG